MKAISTYYVEIQLKGDKKSYWIHLEEFHPEQTLHLNWLH